MMSVSVHVGALNNGALNQITNRVRLQPARELLSEAREAGQNDCHVRFTRRGIPMHNLVVTTEGGLLLPVCLLPGFHLLSFRKEVIER